MCFDAFGKSINLAFTGGGTHQHAIATCAMHLFDHQVFQVSQYITQLISMTALPSLHVLQNRFFLQVKANHLWHKRVNGFVVSYSCAQCVGNDDVALSIHGGQTRYTNIRIGLEAQRIHISVVHAAVNHIHLLRSFGGLHINKPISDKQVGAFHQLDTHLLGQECVFEVSAVKTPRCVQHHRRLLYPT